MLQVLDLNEIEEHGLRGERGFSRNVHEEGYGNGGDFFEGCPTPSLGSMKLSPDQRMLACTIDLEGNDRFVLAVFDLEAGEATLGGGAVRGGFGAGAGSEIAKGVAKAAVLREDAM